MSYILVFEMSKEFPDSLDSECDRDWSKGHEGESEVSIVWQGGVRRIKSHPYKDGNPKV